VKNVGSPKDKPIFLLRVPLLSLLALRDRGSSSNGTENAVKLFSLPARAKKKQQKSVFL